MTFASRSGRNRGDNRTGPARSQGAQPPISTPDQGRSTPGLAGSCDPGSSARPACWPTRIGRQPAHGHSRRTRNAHRRSDQGTHRPSRSPQSRLRAAAPTAQGTPAPLPAPA